ncbi:hypothetical protein EXM22_06130 [Oceanispirochaeta crateris]|uniref:Uncharacterized protein n=1 Tax=Oceanispirochaeta crateris TaxID=2518645 RepID=A0A5C1QHH1_9SPIO|nr:hypothetical protein [Oceanispirochaeta crateris]QEN07585.1 hypothetical protein EXM22_06130 [Oceanispirochaeta crateris]
MMKYVYKNNKLILLILACISLSNCRSTDTSEDQNILFEDEFYMSRPKIIIDSPMAKLPYILKWEGSRSVRSYEIQSAFDLQFTDSRQNWTTKETFLTLFELKSDVVYIRIRSHFDSDTSRWSEIVKLSLESDELRITRVRD